VQEFPQSLAWFTSKDRSAELIDMVY